MQDKQIINGIDVSGCPYNGGDRCSMSRHAYCFCTNKPNCIYKRLKRKEQECKRLKWYMQEIRMQELSHLDIEWDEYETHCIDTDYSNIINLIEEALEEKEPEGL